MPELPEVQTVVDDLNAKIKGDTIVDFWSDWEKTIKNKSIKDFTKETTGRKILGARRIGKNIFIDLSGGPARNASRSDSGRKTIYIHLKMTGHLLVKRASAQFPISNFQSIPNDKILNDKFFGDRVNQYVHHKWFLSSKNKTDKFDTVLEFSDLRKFGKIVLVDTDKVVEIKEIKELGIDAMSKDFTYNKFSEILEKRKNRPIGLILMEQNLISGIGNIYRSEILFNAQINPERKAGTLSTKEKNKIYEQIGEVLKKAIKLRGTSDSDFRDTEGAPGNFQKVLKVYGREKEKCPKCRGKIQRKKIGQRSYFFCFDCQK